MFRKRIATAGVIALSTFTTGVVLPSVASAQVMDMDEEDEDQGSGVIDMDEGSDKVVDLDSEGGNTAGDAAVAGEPTESMAQAKAAFEKKQWAQAAQGLHSVVDGSTGDDAGNVQLAEFYLAQSLYFLKFYQASLDGFSKISANPQHLKFGETLLWLAKLATDLPEPADIISRVGKYSDEQLRRFDNKAQQELYWKLNYLLGRYNYRKGKFGEAIRLFESVDASSTDYVNAQFFSGVSYIQMKKAVAAVKSFQRVKQAVDDGANVEDADRMRDLANLSMARTMYSASIQLDPETNVPQIRADALSAAVKYWNEVDESSEYWLDAHFEAAWAYYMAGQYTRALGNIHTLKSPYFPRSFYPEAEILKAIVYFFNCDYEKATITVARFNVVTTPKKDKLEKVLKKYKGENQEEAFYKFLTQVREGEASIDEEIEPLVETALSDRQLLRNVAYVQFLEKEQQQFGKSPPTFQQSSVGTFVQEKIGEARKKAVAKAGELAMQRYQRYVDEMGEHLRNGEKILIDIVAAQRNLLDQAIKQGQVSEVDAKLFGVVNPDDEHFIWPFDGEYWRDELGFYRQEVESACGR